MPQLYSKFLSKKKKLYSKFLNLLKLILKILKSIELKIKIKIIK